MIWNEILPLFYHRIIFGVHASLRAARSLCRPHLHANRTYLSGYLFRTRVPNQQILPYERGIWVFLHFTARREIVNFPAYNSFFLSRRYIQVVTIYILCRQLAHGSQQFGVFKIKYLHYSMFMYNVKVGWVRIVLNKATDLKEIFIIFLFILGP